jgi:hypothetical protein
LNRRHFLFFAILNRAIGAALSSFVCNAQDGAFG